MAEPIRPRTEIRIVISGPAGCGRSTLAWLIERALFRAGIIVENRDPDLRETESRKRMFEEQCEDAVARNATIVIETKQTR